MCSSDLGYHYFQIPLLPTSLIGRLVATDVQYAGRACSGGEPDAKPEPVQTVEAIRTKSENGLPNVQVGHEIITTKIGLDWAFGLINPCEKLEFHFLIIRSCSIIIIMNYL